MSIKTNNASFSPNEKYILHSCNIDALYLIKTETGDNVQIFKGHTNHIYSCESGFLSPQQIYVIDEEGFLVSYDILSKDLLWKFETGGKRRIPICVNKFAIFVASGPNNNILKLVKLE